MGGPLRGFPPAPESGTVVLHRVHKQEKKDVQLDSTPQTLLTPPKGLSEPTLTKNSLAVLSRRYAKHTSEGDPLETPGGVFWRVAAAVAEGSAEWASREEVDLLARDYYRLMASLDFLPNSPTLMNAGKGNGLQYSACYVLPIPDSMEGIFETNKRTALIHQSGGGTGFSFSRLRPAGDFVGSTGGVASGPVSFLEVYNASTESVKQGGTRRGANMGILRVDHPDIMKFIRCKRDLNERSQYAFDLVSGGLTEAQKATLKKGLLESQISNFNISVGITQAFMDAFDTDGAFDLVHPRTGEVVARLRARDVFKEMTECAWETGDPGIIFLDRINAGPANPVPSMGPVEATNPCGEQPLYPNEACNLGSINLANFAFPAILSDDPADRVNWEKLSRAVRLAVRFLDDVITVNPYPDELIDRAVKDNRRIGLGVMGWADLLIDLGIPYDSRKAVSLGNQIMKFINDTGHDESAFLATVRGPFPNWAQSIYNEGRPLRNSTVTTIAPTGTISIIAGASSGVEPLFALVFDRKGSLEGQLSLETYQPFEDIAKREGFWSEDLALAVREHGTVRDLDSVPPKWRKVFGTAHDIAPNWHIHMQAAWQMFTDNAVSKTINLTHDATVEDVAAAYLLAYSTGCAGITVYRDGCKEGVLHAGTVPHSTPDPTVLLTQNVGREALEAMMTPKAVGLPLREQVLHGSTYEAETPLGTSYITINHDEDGQPVEVLINQGRAGSDIAPLSEALGKLSSMLLRVPSAMPPAERVREMVRKLRGIGGSSSTGLGPQRTRSLPDALARVLAQHMDSLTPTSSITAEAIRTLEEGFLPLGEIREKEARVSGKFCPECGTVMAHEDGCDKCYGCGYSHC